MSESRVNTSASTVLYQTSQYKKIRNELYSEICAAAIKQDIEKLNYLLSLPNASLHMSRSDGDGLVYHLAKSGEARAVEWLVDKFNVSSNEAIRGAAEVGDDLLVNKLLQRGADKGWTIGGYARAGNKDKVKDLISCEHHRRIATRGFAYAGLKDEVSKYLQQGVDPVAAYCGYILGHHDEPIPTHCINESIIMSYVYVGNHNEIQKYKHDNNMRKWAIYAYAQVGDIDAVEQLTVNNDDLNASVWGFAFGGHVELADLVLKRGASKDYAARGYAEACNIEQLNTFIKKNTVNIGYIVHGLDGCGYLENATSILKILTLTENIYLHADILKHVSVNKECNIDLLKYQSIAIKRIMEIENKCFQDAKDSFEACALDRRLFIARELVAYSLNLHTENQLDCLIIELACYANFWRKQQFQEFESLANDDSHPPINDLFVSLIRSLNHNIALVQKGSSVKSIELGVINAISKFKNAYELLISSAKDYIDNELKFNHLRAPLFEILDIKLTKRLLYLTRAVVRAFYWRNEQQLKGLFPRALLKNALCLDILDFKEKRAHSSDDCTYFRNSIPCMIALRKCFGDNADELLLKIYPDVLSIMKVDCFNKEFMDLLDVRILSRHIYSMELVILFFKTAALFKSSTLAEEHRYLIEKLVQSGHIRRLLTNNKIQEQSITAINRLSSGERASFLKMIECEQIYKELLLEMTPSLAYLSADLVDRVLSFTNRKDFRNFASTCKLFRSISDSETYDRLRAPAINFRAFTTSLIRDIDIIPLKHTSGGNSISARTQLSNGNLVTGTHANKSQTAQICVWQVASGKRLIEFETHSGHIEALIEVAPNIIAVGHRKGFIEFYDLNSTQPLRLARIALLSEEEQVCAFTLCSSGKLAFVSYVFSRFKETTYELQIIHFDPASINKSTTTIENIATLPRGLNHNGKLFALDSNRVLIANTYGMYVYGLTGNTKSLPIKSIKFQQEKEFPHVIKLRNNKIVTAFITRVEPKRFVLDIWDLSKIDGQEHLKEVVLPVKESTRGIYNIFERINGELLIIPDDNYGTRMLIVNVDRQNENELIEEFNSNLYSLDNSIFIEDGRYLVTTCGTRVDVFRFPLLNEELKRQNTLKGPR